MTSTINEDVCVISIIVPVYNTEKYLPLCIESILSQNYSGFELLLVDDGSTDHSGAVCDKLAEKDSRIRVFHKENGGVSSARNLGMDHAKGEWVLFMDSDDEMIHNGLNIMISKLSSNIDLAIYGYEVYNDNGDKTYSINNRITKQMTNLEAMAELFAASYYRYQGYIWNKLFRKSVIDSSRLRFSNDIFYNEDRLFIIQFLNQSDAPVSFTTTPVYKYYEREGSMMGLLNKDFNYKYITDLHAQTLINEIVKGKYPEQLSDISNFEVYRSFRRIIRMMKDFSVKDNVIKHKIRSQALESIGIYRFYKYEAQRYKRNILKLIHVK